MAKRHLPSADKFVMPLSEGGEISARAKMKIPQRANRPRQRNLSLHQLI